MDQFIEHMDTNSEIYKSYLTFATRSFVGLVLAGLCLCSVYLLHFLHSIYKLPRQSR
jgi:hypothetical protein